MPLLDISSLRHQAILPISSIDTQVVPVNSTTDITPAIGGILDPIQSQGIGASLSKIHNNLSGINPNLIAEISAPNIGIVKALVLDSNLSQESTWSTPFENSSPENRLPTLLGSLQSGIAGETVSAVTERVGLGKNLAEALEKAGGRSSFTKINSTQIYVNSQSAQIQMTLLFSAWSDARIEVEEPIGLLHQMNVPVKLSDKTLVQNVIADTSDEGKGIDLHTFLPSLIPPRLTLKYGGRTYKDLILQSFSRPLSGNMDKRGNLMQAEVPIVLVGYQAWDGKDVASMYGRKMPHSK